IQVPPTLGQDCDASSDHGHTGQTMNQPWNSLAVPPDGIIVAQNGSPSAYVLLMIRTEQAVLTSTTRLWGALHWSACNTRRVIFASTEDWARFRHSVKNRHRYVLGPSLLGGEKCDGLLSHEHFLEWLLYFLKE